MAEAFANGFTFLLHSVFGLYVLLVLLRVFLQRASVHYHNPLSQLVVKCTQFLVVPLRRFVPSFGRWDGASLVLAWSCALIKLLLVAVVKVGQVPWWLALLPWAFFDVLDQAVDLFFYLMIASILISWFDPWRRHPVSEAVYAITEPTLRFVRRYIPPIAGMDLSPIPVFLIIKLLQITLLHPLLASSAAMAFGFR